MQNQFYDIQFDSILTHYNPKNKKDILSALTGRIENLIGTTQGHLIDLLNAQQSTYQSAIGNGVALFEGQVPRLTKSFTLFCKLKKPIHYDSADRIPVDIICIFLSPAHETAAHLRGLGRITRLFQDQRFCETLRSANTQDEIREALDMMKKRRLAA